MKNKVLLFIILILLVVTVCQAIVISNAKVVDFTENDMYRIKDIILENTNAIDLDYVIYDLNNDGIIDGLDMMIIKRHVLGIEKIPKRKVMNSGRFIQGYSR